MKKLQKIRFVNAVVWALIAATLMIAAYFQWSKYGEYTGTSFFASLVVHGGINLLLGVQVDEAICRKYNGK